ncbi:unnamed protein product [Cochlearia groenlandica]
MKKLQRYLQEESIKETSMELLLQCCLNGEMQNYHFTASELQVLCDLLVMTIKEINARIEMLRVRAEALPLLESQVVSDADVAKPVPMEAPKTEEGSHHQAAAATATTKQPPPPPPPPPP